MAPPALFTCPSCQNHVKASESACPHCGARLGGEARLLRSATAVLMGLTLAACPGDSKPEPEYGVPATESATGTSDGSTSDGSSTGTGTGTSMTSGSGTMGGTTMTSAEPEYGVPATESATGTTTTTTGTTTAGSTTVMTTAEPDYGVPATTSG